MMVSFTKRIPQPFCASPGGLVLLVLLVGLAASGCNKTCVSFTSNPPQGTVEIKASDSKVACPASTARGAVSVAMFAAPICSGCSGAASVPHIFLSLRGVEAQASGRVAEDSPDWEELAPQLAQHPVQVDLMARPAAPCAAGALGGGTVAAGVYRQLRLRLVPNQPSPGEAVPEENACGDAGFNCVITADRGIQPLALDGEAPEVRIASEKIASGFLLVLPDARTDLAIEFNAYASLLRRAADGLRFLPALTAVQGTRCPSGPPPAAP